MWRRRLSCRECSSCSRHVQFTNCFEFHGSTTLAGQRLTDLAAQQRRHFKILRTSSYCARDGPRKKNDYLRKYAKVVFYEHFLSLELVVEVSLALALHTHSRIRTPKLIHTHTISRLRAPMTYAKLAVGDCLQILRMTISWLTGTWGFMNHVMYFTAARQQLHKDTESPPHCRSFCDSDEFSMPLGETRKHEGVRAWASHRNACFKIGKHTQSGTSRPAPQKRFFFHHTQGGTVDPVEKCRFTSRGHKSKMRACKTLNLSRSCFSQTKQGNATL